MPDRWIDDLLRPDRDLRVLGSGIWSALSAGGAQTPYDRHAAGYDRLVGNRLYNRLVWGASTASYTAFAAAAVDDGDGPLLDVGCGTAVFTSDVYAATSRPLVLVDRSHGMLARTAGRLDAGPDGRIALVHADLFDLPFRAHAFPTVACHGLLHLFDDVPAVLRALGDQVSPGGTLYASSLVAGRGLATRWLQMMHRAGEAARPRRIDELDRVTRAEFDDVRTGSQGSMAYIIARP